MFALGFLLGLLIGASIVVAYGTYQMMKLSKAKQDLMTKMKEKLNEVNTSVLADADKAQSVRDRLAHASQLTEEQAALRAQAEMPSKNSLHSRYKNGLIHQIMDLEAQKIDILKTILGDGIDPPVTVYRDGGAKEEILLSAYVAQAEAALATMMPPPPPPGNDPSTPRKAGKFVIYTGGRDDGNGETTH